MHYGDWPKNEIDHINKDKQDNRINNLRDVTTAENQRNRKLMVTNKSGACGVHKLNKRYSALVWSAVIMVDKKQIYLGSFRTKEQAIKARKAAERKHGFHPNHGKKR